MTHVLPARPKSMIYGAAVAAMFALVTTAATRAENWAPNLTVAATWESNATHADISTDQIDSVRLNGDALVSQRYPFGRDDALHVTLHADGEWWPRYNGLTSGTGGGRVGWRHQFGANPLAPVLMADGFADGVIAKDTGQRGHAIGGMFGVRKRFDAATRATLTHEVTWFDARYGVYDRGASATSLELERDLNTVTRISLTARYRDGDVVSYASGDRPDLAGIAPQRLDTDLFGRPLTAYRVDARTWSARAALVRALDENAALIVAYEWRNSRRQPLRFTNHQLSISLVHQF